MFMIEASSRCVMSAHSNKRPCARSVEYDACRRGRSQRGERIEVNHSSDTQQTVTAEEYHCALTKNSVLSDCTTASRSTSYLTERNQSSRSKPKLA